ncbi:MAG: outer membrane protein assembly factor BamB family protein [Treponema sp.]
MKNRFILLFLFLSSFIFAQEMEAFWTLVFAGKNITTPVFSNGRIYTAGADRALNCITTKGTFLWRRNTTNYPTSFISTSNDGVVYLVTQGNNIEAYSSQGMPIWNYKCEEELLFPLYVSNDGYLLVTFKKKLLCLTRQGKLKWVLELPETPIKAPVEVDQKNVILILKDESFLRLSMFGKVLEQLSLKKNINVIHTAPKGYVISCDDSSISYYQIASPSKLLWQTNEKSLCRSFCYKNGKLLCVFSNGDVVLKNLNDGSVSWQENLGVSFGIGAKCSVNGNEFNIVDKGFGATLTDKGKVRWKRNIPENDFMPIITENGLLIGIKKEILNAYRVETKLLRQNEKRIDHSKFYMSDKTIKNEKEVFSDRASMLYLLGFSTFDFFNNIQDDINNGDVGVREGFYAQMLTGIIQNDAKGSYFPHEFSSFERGRAAALLGQLGLYQYRDVLLSQINITMDAELALGILKGLSALAYDPDGRTIEGINFILNRFSASNEEVVKGVADAFFALAKFGDEVTAKRAVKSVFAIMNTAYPAVIREYVREKIKDIGK